MTALIRNPLVWHGAVGILLILGFVFGGSVLGAAWPIVAVVVWCYVTWRLLAGRAALRLAAMQVHVLDRTPPKVPRIDGTVAAPTTAATVDPDEMAAFLGGRVIGQDAVARQLARGIYRRMAQERRGKPVFTVLLSGPTGTGKTEMAKAMADFLYGDADSLFRVDCAQRARRGRAADPDRLAQGVCRLGLLGRADFASARDAAHGAAVRRDREGGDLADGAHGQAAAVAA